MSPDIYDARASKIAATIVAVHEGLTKKTGPQSVLEGFQSAYRHLHQLDSETFTRLAHSPQAYCWTHWMYDTLGDRPLAQATDSEFLEPLCHRFALLVLGASMGASRDMRLFTPVTVSLPYAIPCTALALGGEGEARIVGCRGRTLIVEDGNGQRELTATRLQKSEGLSLVEQPVIRSGDHEVLVSPVLFRESQIDHSDRDYSLQLGIDGHWDFLPRLEQGLRLVEESCPHIHRQMLAVVNCIGLTDPVVSGLSQTSLSDLPGTFIISCYSSPFNTADALIHEFHHNRLFALEEEGPMFVSSEDESGTGDYLVFSPWRVAPRPVKGLLHSLYVFVPVAEYWHTLYEKLHPEDSWRALACDECIRQLIQLRLGSALLKQHAIFADHGREVFESILSKVERLEKRHAALGIPHDAPTMLTNKEGGLSPLRWKGYGRTVSVRENLRANIQRADRLQQCASTGVEV